MVTIRNMTNNVVQEETSDHQMDPREMMRNMQKRISDMCKKYEEELRALHVENAAIQQEWGTKGLMPSTPTLSGLRKQRRDEPYRTVQRSSFGASKDHNPSMVTIDTTQILPFTPGIAKAHLPDNWKMPIFEKYEGFTIPNEHIRMFMYQMALYTINNVTSQSDITNFK